MYFTLLDLFSFFGNAEFSPKQLEVGVEFFYLTTSDQYP